MPGFEIPSRYFQFVRSGDARGLDGVLEHNRLDVLSLAMLTAQGGPAAGRRRPRGPHRARGAGPGRLYERGGMIDEARACFARAIELDADVLTRVEALQGLRGPVPARAALPRGGRRMAADAGDARVSAAAGAGSDRSAGGSPRAPRARPVGGAAVCGPVAAVQHQPIAGTGRAPPAGEDRPQIGRGHRRNRRRCSDPSV